MSVGSLTNHSFTIRGWVTTILKDPQGNIKSVRTTPNILKPYYMDFMASAFALGNPSTRAIYLGLACSTDSGITGPDSIDNTISAEAANWTQTSENGTGGRMTGSHAHVAQSINWTISTSWSGGNSSASTVVAYVALAACQSIGGTPILAAASFALVSKASQDTLTIAWTFCLTQSA